MRGRMLALATLLLFHGCTCTTTSGPASSESPPPQQGCQAELFKDGGGLECVLAGGSCIPDAGCPTGTYHDESYECAQGVDVCCLAARDASTDATTTNVSDASAGGICNGAACGAGCTCLPADTSSGTTCACGDAGDASDASAADGESDVALPDGAGDAAEEGADASEDAPAASMCGVIACATPCQCVDPGASRCECP